MSRNPHRYLTLQVPAETMAELVRIADEDGRSPATLALQWLDGGLRDYEPREEGHGS